ncbi:MAG: hypothetical protein JXR96_25875 [Deltaproteobacteria bacterium]|nr:hypothetical protein [Deltaproteobacteria bacterium]
MARKDFVEMMEEWPESWAGTDEDIPMGRGLVAELRPFVAFMEKKGLAHKTLRNHVNNLWQIGGDLISSLNYDPELRKKSPRELLLDAIAVGEAPLSRHATENEQRSLDATARKLLRFMQGKG